MTPPAYPDIGPTAPARYTDALRRGVAAVPHCRRCDRRFFYPRPVCPLCLGEDLDFTAVPGPWTVLSRAHVERAQAALFSDWTPVLLLAAASAGVSIIAEGQGWPASAPPEIGAHVRYRVTARPDGTPIPVFLPEGHPD